jgi:hypothetical protein
MNRPEHRPFTPQQYCTSQSPRSIGYHTEFSPPNPMLLLETQGAMSTPSLSRIPGHPRISETRHVTQIPEIFMP